MAINDPGRQVDGFTALTLGMDGSVEPDSIRKENYALGINVVSRGGKVKTRPGFAQLSLESDPEDPTALTEFENGFYQGGCIFTESSSQSDAVDLANGGAGKTYIIVAASGWIFRIDPILKRIVRLNGTPGTSLIEQTINSVAALSTTVTVTTNQAHGLKAGDKVTVSGCTPNTMNSNGETVVLTSPSFNTFTYSVATNFATATSATVVGSYSISPDSKGYLVLPKFMDTTYYTLKVSAAYPVTPGSGITNNSKVIIEDPQPTRLSIGVSGSGFQASTVSSNGVVSYINISNGGEGFSDSAKASSVGSTNSQLSLRFKRDASATNRPWPDRNNTTNRHTFCQAEKFLIIQDGINKPFIFDGTYLRRSYTSGNQALSFGVGNKAITNIVVTHKGAGYTATPSVVITPAAGDTTGAGASATPVFNSTSGQVDAMNFTPGANYTAPPVVTITRAAGDTTGAGAQAYATLNNPQEVPVGSVMAYGQGRLFVASPNRFEVKALDFVGTHVNKTSGKDSQGNTVYPLKDPRASILFNTEDQYLSGGGSFLMPSYMGRITGMRFLPTKDVAAGQGDLYVFCEFGAASFKVGEARASWGATQRFQSLLFDKIGSVGPDAFAGVNGDLFFRSADGIRTYRNAAASLEDYGNTALSSEIDKFLDQEPLKLLYNVSMAYTNDSRLLMTAQPVEIPPATINDKTSLCYKALVSMDLRPLNRASNKSSLVYDGLWTGLDFLQLFSGEFGRKNIVLILASCCSKLTLWAVDENSSFDKPLPGVQRTLRSSFLTGTHQGTDLIVPMTGDIKARFSTAYTAPTVVMSKNSGYPFTGTSNWWVYTSRFTSGQKIGQIAQVTYLVPPGISYIPATNNPDTQTSKWRLLVFEGDPNLGDLDPDSVSQSNSNTDPTRIPTSSNWGRSVYFEDNYFSEIPLTDFGLNANDRYFLNFTAVNSAINWTNLTAGQSNQGLSLFVYYSETPLGSFAPTTRQDFSSVSRTINLYYNHLPNGQVSASFYLGNLKPSGFLYVGVNNIGTLPQNNKVNYSVSLKSFSSGSNPIVSQLETKSFGFDSPFELKRLARGDLWVSDMEDYTKFNISFRPDKHPDWVFWDEAAFNAKTDNVTDCLEFDSIIKNNITTAQTLSYCVDLNKYLNNNLGGLGAKFTLTTGATGPGNGVLAVKYQTSDLTPASRNGLTQGSQAYIDFYNNMQSFDVSLPTGQSSKNYVNMLNAGQRYLYMDISYPTVNSGAFYNMLLEFFFLSQNDTTPNLVQSSGFFTVLKNFQPQYVSQIKLMTPADVENKVSGSFFHTAYEFQLRLVWSGKAGIQKGFLHALPLVENVKGNSL